MQVILGFLGCKTPYNGKTVLGVDIFIGGTLSGEGGEGHLLLKGIVLEHAREYVAELMRQYRDHRTPKESLEKFILRLQARYTNASIGFLMRWNRQMRLENKLEALLSFNLKRHGGSHKEQDEIFEFGTHIVHNVTGENPYDTDEPLAEAEKKLSP